MTQTQSTVASSTGNPVGTGGFLDPENVVDGFNIKEGMHIVDFGSGAGYFTISLAERVGDEGKVYALDVQEYALDNVRAKARAYGLNNIETIRTNLEILGSSSLADKSQDIILMANILFQSKKRGDIIKEGKRILKSGGELIVIDWNKGTGGFGPPNDIRPDPKDIKKMTESEDFVFERSIDAGSFHFGLLFTKK